ncbi:MAG: hypothetical protein ACFFAN_07050 [Promethearchaeota archaeon]
MIKELISVERGTFLRKNDSHELKILFKNKKIRDIFVINGTSFITEIISKLDLIIKPKDYYMIINYGKEEIEIIYSSDISNHEIIYDPYKYENSQKVNLNSENFRQKYKIPYGYVGTLPKWYSFKFCYPDYNLIFIRPELGLSIQAHKFRNEYWEVLEGKPIIIMGNEVHYFVEKGKKFKIPINTYHSIINPNLDKFVLLKEQWSGKFDENDIERVFNPNHSE